MAAQDYASIVQQLYISYFGRPADYFGLQNFEAQLDAIGAPTNLTDLNAAVQAGKTPALNALINSFATSSESVALYGTDNSPIGISKFLVAVFTNVLGRAPALGEGWDFWYNALASGNLSRANAALAIAEGATTNTTAQGLLDAQTIANKQAVANAFTAALDTPTKINAYSTAAAVAVASGLLQGVTPTTNPATYQSTVLAAVDSVVATSIPTVTTTLTTGVDNLVGGAGNDVFNALPGASNAATFTPLDSIDGGGGNNTLNVTNIGALDLTAAAGSTVKNIQTANLNATTTVKGDVSGWTGLTTLNVGEVGGNNGGSITAATTTAVKLVDGAQAAGNISLVGGSNVTVNSSGVTTGTITVAGNKGTVGVTTSTSSGTQGQITVSSGSTITVTETATNTTVGTTVTQGAVVVNGDATTTSVTVSQTAAASATAAVAQVGTVTMAGTTAAAGDRFSITLNGTTYTTAAAAGGETPAAIAAALQALIPGSAPVTAAVVGNTVVLTAKVAGTAFTASAASVVNTGGLTESAVAPTTANVVASGNGIGNGTVQITDANSSNTDGTKANTIATVALDGYGTATINSNALTKLSLANSAAGVTITDNTSTPTNTTLAVTVNNLGSGATLADGTIKNLNITTAGKDSALAVTAGAVTALTIAGTNAVDLSSSSLGALKTVTVSGAAGVTGNFSGGTVTAVDSSASTGAVTVSVDATKATFKGGSGVSTVTIVADATTKIAAGAGTADVLVANAAGGTFTAANTAANVTGFEILRTGTASQGIYDMYSVFTTEKSINVAAAAAGALTFSGAAAGTSLSIDVAPVANVTFGLKVDTPSDSLNLSFGKASVDGVDFTGGNTYSVNVGAIETLNITSVGSNKAGTNTNTANVVDSAVTSLKIAGSESLVLKGLGSNTVTTIDTSGIGKGLTVDLTGITVASSGVTLTGGAGAVKFTDSSIAAGKTDTVTAGDGDNIITIGAGNSGKATVTLGNGNNTVNLTGTQGKDIVTVGNGNNNIIGGDGADTINVGSGNNSVKGGMGADVITFAAHTGKVGTVVMSASGDTGANNATVTQTSELANTFDVIKGFTAGDKIDLSAINAGFYGTSGLVLAGTNLAAVDNKVVFVTGTYDATAGTFTYSASGADTAVTYDTTTGSAAVTGETIILVGVHAGATTTATGGVITLG